MTAEDNGVPARRSSMIAGIRMIEVAATSRDRNPVG
jgi:hypothetical protein